MNGALSLFLQEMRCSKVFRPSYQSFAGILKSCAGESNIELGKAFHGHVVKLGHETCLLVSKALLNMYAKCKAFDECQKMFIQMRYRDAVTWNIVLSGLSGSRNHDVEVMRLFYAMHSGKDPRPTSVSIAIILPVCARLGALGAAKSLHAFSLKSGIESEILVGNALISLYAKFGNVQVDARAVFDGMEDKDIVSWNAMIAGLAENRLMGDAFKLFCLMLKGPTIPNCATIANVLPVCAILEENVAYCIGKEIHCYVLQRNEMATDMSVTNALVSFYLRIGQLKMAESLFQRMEFKDLVTWNSIIGGYASNGLWLKALESFHQFLSGAMSIIDSVTLISILPVCGHLGNLPVGKQIHGYIIQHPNLCEDNAVGNALISFYAKCSDVDSAFQTFVSIRRKDLISWNTVLDAFAESQFEIQFVDLLNWMFREGIRPDTITILTTIQFYAVVSKVDKIKEAHGFSMRSGLLLANREPTLGNAIIDAYAKCGKMEYAQKMFESLPDNMNVVTCNSIISGFVHCGSPDDAHTIFSRMSKTDLTTWNLVVRVYAENECPSRALSLFHELQNHGMNPDIMTIMSILPVCAQTASILLLRQCHGYVIRSCFEDVRLKGALLDIYSKCGNIGYAQKLFLTTQKKDLVMFTAMLCGYAMHGMGQEAVNTYFRMLELGLMPDHVVITAVLSACSHAGLVDEGLKIFDSIENKRMIKPTMEHYNCIVDLLSRGGRINDAFSLVSRMPIEANAHIWSTLLGACKTHHELDIGRAVADRLLDIEAVDIGNYVVMSNLYAANARWDEVLSMRKFMKARDLKKPAGCSWIEVEKKKNVFIAGDTAHPQRNTIYFILETLGQQIKKYFISELVYRELQT